MSAKREQQAPPEVVTAAKELLAALRYRTAVLCTQHADTAQFRFADEKMWACADALQAAINAMVDPAAQLGVGMGRAA